jgi:hypothetical protein
VSESGIYFIGYSAQLNFAGLSLGYAATLSAPELAGVRPGPSVGFGPLPERSTDHLSWQYPELGFSGVWRAIAPGTRLELLSTPEGSIVWHCLQPAAQVTLTPAVGAPLSALGYAEHVTLTLPPWRLGLAELIWGRFVSPSSSLVWISWAGTHPRQIVLSKGHSVAPVEISTHRVRTNSLDLTIEPGRVLREGAIGDNVLSKVRGLSRLAPVAFLTVNERKWLSRGTLRTSDGGRTEGWIIHETVTWPNGPADRG